MKVLIATDGSNHAHHAAWLLSHLPHREPLDLTVLTVLQTPYVNSPRASEQWLTETVNREREFAQQTYQKTAALFDGAEVSLRQVIRDGSRGQEIVDEAKQWQADLIVLGARGHSAVDRILLGSTSDFVATHADCSVLVVRPTGLKAAPDRPLRVVLAYDGSIGAQTAMHDFEKFSWGPQTELDVVNVISYVSGLLTEVPVDLGALKGDAAAGLDQAVAHLRTVAPIARSQLIESDHVGEGLIRFIEREECDLAIVGDNGRGGLSRLFLGSVSRFILRHARCSVWISRRRPRDPREVASAERAAEANR